MAVKVAINGFGRIGRLAFRQAMLNTIPLEISFVDIDNINRYFNEGPKRVVSCSLSVDIIALYK